MSLSQPCLPVPSVGLTRILPHLYLGSQKDVLNKVWRERALLGVREGQGLARRREKQEAARPPRALHPTRLARLLMSLGPWPALKGSRVEGSGQSCCPAAQASRKMPRSLQWAGLGQVQGRRVGSRERLLPQPSDHGDLLNPKHSSRSS